MAEAQTQLGAFDIVAPTPIVFVHLVKPRRYHEGQKDQGNPYYEVTWLLDGPDAQRALETAAAVAKEAFPGRDFKTLKFPFQKGDELEKHKWAHGHTLLQCRSPNRPAMAVALNGSGVDLNRDDDAEVAANIRYFYSGVEAVGRVKFTAYEGMGGGVKAYINHVMSLNRGEKRGGGASTSEIFGGYIGLTSDEDPTKGQTGNQSLAGII